MSAYFVSPQVLHMPAEIMQRIFLQYISSDKPSHQIRARSILLQICRHWRSLVLGDSALWTNITDIRPGWVETMVMKSATRPISLTLTGSSLPKGEQEVIDGLVQQGRRLRILDIYGDASKIHGYLEELAPFAPHLEKLTISVTKDDALDEWPEDLDTLFPGGAPLLQTLSLYSYQIPTSSPFLAHVKTLVLGLGQYDDFPYLSADHFLSGLSKMPNLVHLHIAGEVVERRLYTNNVDIVERVPLPRLEKLCLMEMPDVRGCVALLSALLLPTSVKTSVCFDPELFQFGEHSNLSEALHRAFSSRALWITPPKPLPFDTPVLKQTSNNASTPEHGISHLSRPVLVVQDLPNRSLPLDRPLLLDRSVDVFQMDGFHCDALDSI